MKKHVSYDRRIIGRILNSLPERANCYLYGSRVYGNYRFDSDHDFQIVVPFADYNVK